jgi:Curlin associated repeat
MYNYIKLWTVVLALFTSVAFGADNSIYIDQSGDNSTIDVTQTGAGNVVRGIQGVGSSNSTPAKIYGDNNAVDVRQIGSTNTLNLGVNTSTATGRSYGIDLTYYVTGNSATATINSNNAGTGTSGSNFIDVRQTGNSAGLNLNMLGSKNDFTAVTSGGASNSIVATINADSTVNNISMTGGGSNTLTETITSNKATNNITTVGASNGITLTQSGTAGTNGHAFTLDLTGSSSTFNVTQSGTIDTTVNLKSVGSGNTWNITTGN